MTTIYLMGDSYFEEGVDGDFYVTNAVENILAFTTEAARDAAALAADREFVRELVKYSDLRCYCPEYVIENATERERELIERTLRLPSGTLLTNEQADEILAVLTHLQCKAWEQELRE